MSTLATFCGKHGDILWALPTVRALSEARGERIDFVIGGEFAGLLPILRQQPYLGTVYACDTWGLSSPETWKVPQTWLDQHPEIDEVFDVSYRGWPELDLARTAEANLHRAWPDTYGPLPQIDLERPWMQIQNPWPVATIAVGFTEEWFELKLGLLIAAMRDKDYVQLTPPASRWITEGSYSISKMGTDWTTAAEILAGARGFVGDCSALHVLAIALGKPCVIVEPSQDRWNPIFWPKGITGHGVECVMGNDGRPSFDARALRAKIQEMFP